jgi:hypothetical protein
MESLEVIERYIILLLGAKPESPVPTPTHLQKEIFLLAKANPKIEKFVYFNKHYFGPYSPILDEISKNPAINSNAYFIDENKHYHITKEGQRLYNKIIGEFEDKKKIEHFISIIKMVRDIYDSLTTDELLFLIYITYPEYTEQSEKSNQLLQPQNKKRLALKLLEMGKITQEKYLEIVGG